MQKDRKREQNSNPGNPHIRDVNSKTIFQNSELCMQFLRDNINIPLFRDLRPEDIEDVSERMLPYAGTEYFGDTIKRIHLPGLDENNTPLYVISLIEHKSKVDYNITMQMLRYMTGIWWEYEKEMKQSDKSSRKSFRYPPILPIVYYEGADNWTADMHLKDRILMNELFAEYIPDFTYRVVRNHDYSDEELLSRKDEMSLLMLLSKLQKADDWEELKSIPKEEINRIVSKTSESVLEILAATVWSLCRRIEVPEEEMREFVEQIKERNMGYLFENVTFNLQEERRKVKREAEEVKREAEEVKREAEEVKREAEEVKREAEEVKREAEEVKREAKREVEDAKREAVAFKEICEEIGMNKEAIAEKLIDKLGISREEADILLK